MSADLYISLYDSKCRTIAERVRAVADSGADVTIIPPSCLNEQTLKSLVPTSKIIRCAKQETIKIDGKIWLNISVHPEARKYPLLCYVTSEAEKPLISRMALKMMSILPPDFPACRVYGVTAELTHYQKTKWEKLMSKYEHVFKEGDTNPMKAPPLMLKLKPGNHVPHCVTTTRRYPVHIEKDCIADLEKLERLGIIAPVTEPTEWCSHSFFLSEGPNKRRFIVDLSQLSKVIDRPVHPFLSTADVLKGVDPRMAWFSTMDAKSGYFQLELDPRCRHLTTFMTQVGKKFFRRCPMGLSASSDWWCRCSDQVLHGINNIHKLVDDILITAYTFDGLLSKTEEVLARCLKFNMHLNGKKIQMGREVKFAGFSVFEGGYRPLPEKLAAISEFKRPENVTDVRSFLGLVNHLSISHPDISQASEPLRSLLKKDVHFLWGPDQESAFVKLKEIVLSPQTVHFYDPKLPSEIFCDAARNAGLGYVMLQKDKDGNKRLIKCGSRSLTDCESRYSATELELLGLTYSLIDCKYYLLFGPNFRVFTDHRALVGLFKKNMADIENTRLQRLREKVAHFDFTVEWLPGKNNVIADVLSRNPVFKPTPEEDEESLSLQYANVNQIGATLKLIPDLGINRLLEFAEKDRSYARLKRNLSSNEERNLEEIWEGYPSRFKEIFSDLSLTPDGNIVMYGDRLVVPSKMIPSLIETLHMGHPGIGKMQAAARRLYFFPQMKSIISDRVKTCEDCRRLLPSQPLDKFKNVDFANEPMEILCLDIFTVSPKNYLIIVDQYSKFFFVYHLKTLATEEVIKKLNSVFLQFGFSRMVITDGGGSFRTAFHDFLESQSVYHRVSSPYWPRANGISEEGVRRAKYLLQKVEPKEFELHMLHFLAQPMEGRRESPAELFFGRLPRLPNLPQGKFVRPEQNMSSKEDKLKPFALGDRVLIQNPISKKWDSKGKVVKVHRNERSYDLETDDGRIFRRNRIYLRVLHETAQ